MSNTTNSNAKPGKTKVTSAPEDETSESSTIDDITDELSEAKIDIRLGPDGPEAQLRRRGKRGPPPRPGNMPLVHDTPKLLYRRQAMMTFTVFVTLFNIASVLVAILQYARGAIDSEPDQIAAVRYIAITGCVDVLISLVILCRNRWLQHRLFAQSFHQNTKYHVLFAVQGCVCFILHGMFMMSLKHVSFSASMLAKDTSGLNIWLTVWMICGTSMPSFRQISYKGYHVGHWFLYLWLLIFGSVHSPTVVAPLFTVATVIYLVDYLRFKRAAQNQPRNIKSVQFMRRYGLVKLVVEKPKDFVYQAGQFAYLCFPELGLTEWHPFSFASAPHETDLLFVIRSMGPWTNRIFGLLDQYQKRLKKGGPNGAPLPPILYIDGPEGQVMNAADTDQRHYDFKHVLFISGGRGVTPTQALFNDFLQHRIDTKTEDKVKSIDFVWLAREDETICDSLLKKDCSLDQVAYLHFQPNLLDGDLIQAFPKDAIGIQFYLTSCYQLRLASVKRNASPTPNPLFAQKPGYIQPVIRKVVDLEAIVREAAQRVSRGRDKWLQIFLCGPDSLVKDVERFASVYRQLDCRINISTEAFT